MADNKINVGGRFHSIATGNVLAGANEILDDSKNKKQSVINAEVDAAIADRYTKEETYNKDELNSLITTPGVQYVTVAAIEQTTAVTDVLPATGAADTIYRVGNWDGTQYNDSVFSEYAWNGSAYIKLSTKSQIGEVYDISANHADTKYADLATALGTNGENVPEAVRKGGMSVKFVQSSDNKYVQYRLMSTAWNTNVANWQGVDDEPTDGSHNLVESGGVKSYADTFNNKINLLFFGNSLTLESTQYVPWMLKQLAPELKFNIIVWYEGGATLSSQLNVLNGSGTADMILTSNEQEYAWVKRYNKSVSELISLLPNDELNITIQEFTDNVPYFNHSSYEGVIDKLKSFCTHEVKFHHLLEKTITGDESLAKRAREFALTAYNTLPIASIVNPGSAFDLGYNDTIIHDVITEDSTYVDTTHAAEGLPCYLENLVVVNWIFDLLGRQLSINKNSLILNSTNYTSMNVQDRGNYGDLGIIFGTNDEQLRCQKLAQVAYNSVNPLLKDVKVDVLETLIDATYENGGGYVGVQDGAVSFVENNSWHGFHFNGLNENDVVEIKGVGGGSYRLWYVCDGTTVKRIADAYTDGNTGIRITIQNGENSIYGSFNDESYENGAYCKLITSSRFLNHKIDSLNTYVDNTKTSLEGDITNLNNQINNIINAKFEPNAIINTTIGTVISDYVDNTWIHSKIECFEGETYKICGSGGSSIRLWSTVDSRGVVKRNSAASVTSSTPIEVTIAADERYIIVNSLAAYNNTLLQRTSLVHNVEEVYECYKSLRETANTNSIFSLHGVIDSNGTFYHNSDYEATNFLYLGSEDTLSYKVYAVSNMGGIFCYDKYKKFIDIYNTGIVLGTNYIEGNVAQSSLPAGTTYVRVFRLKNGDGYISGTVDESALIDSADTIICPNNPIYPESYHKLGSNVNLNTAISDLHNIGGGVINLLNWNTNGLPIQMAYDDVALVGLSPEYTRISTTQQAGSIVVGDGVTAKVSNIHFNAMYKCKKNSKLILHNVVIEHPLQSIGTIHFDGEAPSVYYMCSSDSSSKAYFFEEISTSDDAGAAIQSTLDNYTEVYLAIGTYNTTTTIRLNSNNLLSCVSQTYRATIQRQQSGNYCIMANTNAKNMTVQKLWCNSFVRLDMNNGENGHLIDTVFNGKYIAKDVWVACKGVNTFKLGKNFNESLTLQGIIELLTYPYRVVYDDNSVKYRIEVYGKCSETNANSVNINDTLEIEGMTDDAELSFTINSNQSALCLYDREGEENHTSIKNLKLTMYGTYGGWQYGVLHVGSNWAYLENLEIRNYHDCATPRSASDIDTAPNTVVDGDRKQGCVISINHYDNDCHTEFHNVKSYGSPYGFKNCRGFYVMRGSPKFYNCVGVGGGFGRYGYGWVLHHASKPYMYNCIGIGSPYGWGLNNGIQFQMNTEALLFNCVGIGNTNKQRYSNGNKNMVVLNTLSEASHGYCCYMEVHPTLMNCVGYAADVDGSYAFNAGFDSRPQIEGGYYGKEVKVICNKVSLTDDTTSQIIDAGNSLYPIELKCIGFRDTLVNMPTGQKVVIKVDGTIICEATESVQQQCPPVSNPIVPAGSVVTCEVVDSNNAPVSNANLNFDVIVRYMGHNQMTAIYIENSASPRIRHATLSGNLLADGLHINCPDTADYLIDECTIDVPSTNYAIKSSSQKAVKVVNCVMTSGNVQNVTFAQTTTLGSNVVI